MGAPWYVIRFGRSSARAAYNCISHVLKAIPYKRLSPEKVICQSGR